MTTWANSNRRAYRSLFFCFIFALVSLIPHIVRPVETTLIYGGLTIVLVAVNVAALRWFSRAPCVAVQTYWYTALVVVAIMVVVDARRGNTDLPLPFIVAIPPLATVIIRLFVSWRASLVYGVGALALIIPTGFVYREIGQAVILVGIVVLAVLVGRRRQPMTTHDVELQAMTQEVRKGTQALLDVIPEG